MEAKSTLEKHVATKLQKENPDKTPRGKNFQGKHTVEQNSSKIQYTIIDSYHILRYINVVLLLLLLLLL